MHVTVKASFHFQSVIRLVGPCGVANLPNAHLSRQPESLPYCFRSWTPLRESLLHFKCYPRGYLTGSFTGWVSQLFHREMRRRTWRKRTLQLLWIFKRGNIVYISLGCIKMYDNVNKMRVNYLLNMSAFVSDSAGSWRREPRPTGRSRLFGTGNGKQLSDFTWRCKAICQSTGHNEGAMTGWIYFPVKDDMKLEHRHDRQSDCWIN